MDPLLFNRKECFLLKSNVEILMEILLLWNETAIQELASLERHKGFVLVLSLLAELGLSEQ